MGDDIQTMSVADLANEVIENLDDPVLHTDYVLELVKRFDAADNAFKSLQMESERTIHRLAQQERTAREQASTWASAAQALTAAMQLMEVRY
jgi:hypothetical protein